MKTVNQACWEVLKMMRESDKEQAPAKRGQRLPVKKGEGKTIIMRR